jgi:hypothetical protein
MRLLGHVDRVVRTGRGPELVSLELAEAALRASKYVSSLGLLVVGEGPSLSLGAVYTGSSLMRGAEDEGSRAKLFVDLFRVGTAAGLQWHEIPSVVVSGEAADFVGPPETLPARLAQSYEGLLTLTVEGVASSTWLHGLAELKALVAEGMPPLTGLARLLEACLPAARAGDVLKCVLNKHGGHDEGPRLRDMGLDTTRAQVRWCDGGMGVWRTITVHPWKPEVI